MNSKERAELRAQANTLPVLFQVGKGGVSDALIAQTLDAFRTRELVKLKALLETVPEPPRALAEQIAARCGAELVHVVGGSMLFYKENPELHAENAKKEKAKQKKAVKKPRVGIRARQAKIRGQGLGFRGQGMDKKQGANRKRGAGGKASGGQTNRRQGNSQG